MLLQNKDEDSEALCFSTIFGDQGRIEWDQPMEAAGRQPVLSRMVVKKFDEQCVDSDLTPNDLGIKTPQDNKKALEAA